MKRLFSACICLLFCINSYAKEVVIPMHKADHETREIDKRAVSIKPVVTHDGAFISINFPIPIACFLVVVKDVLGNIVYINTVAETSKCHTFEISNLVTTGNYSLEIEIGNQNYCGNFSL